MKSTNHILKYLNHIKKLIIEFNIDQFLQNENENIIFLISNDAFFANDILNRYSSQEYAFKLFNDIIDWKTFKQRTIITSFIEIELLIISSANKKLVNLKTRWKGAEDGTTEWGGLNDLFYWWKKVGAAIYREKWGENKGVIGPSVPEPNMTHI
jgi:hypothetical protein